MIEPRLSGRALCEEIEAARPPRGSLALWRTGQAGFVCRFAAATALIDMYLSNHLEAVLPAPQDHRRLTRAPLDPAEIAFGDVVVCTHDHLDHLDPPTMRTLSRQLPDAVAVTPRCATELAGELGWPAARRRGTRHGDGVACHGLTITAFACAHEAFDEDPEDGHPYQGYLIADGDVSIAHLGDTVDHPKVRDALRTAAPDLALVAINGRSAQRGALGFAGNTHPEEAVELCLAAGVTHAIPMHYDMFAQNVDGNALERFRRAATESGLAHTALEVGEGFSYAATDGR